MTFVFSEKAFPGTWQLSDCDLLCALVAGELTANQLRMHAYLSDREAVKEERREAHIKRCEVKIRNLEQDLGSAIAIGKTTVTMAKADVEAAEGRYDQLVSKLKSMMEGVFPLVGKAKVLQVLEGK